MLKINEKFAKKYDEYRRKEELQKFKDKFGDVTLSEAKRRLGKRGGDSAVAASPSLSPTAAAAAAAASASSSTSSSESEDSDCEAWTLGMEAGFLRVYSALHTGDSRLYDASVSWFPDAAGGDEIGEGEGEGEAKGEGSDGGQKKAKHKPMYYNEYHRKYLLAGAYQTEDGEAPADAAAAESGRGVGRNPNDMREAEMIRKSLADAHAIDSDTDEEGRAGDSANGDVDAPFLVKKARRKTGERSNGDCDHPMAKLHKFVSQAGDEAGLELNVEPQCKDDLAKLRRHWTNEASLSESERYLRDYITKEFWRQPAPQQLQGRRNAKDSEGSEAEDSADGERNGDDGDGEQLSEDEAFLARQSEFESRWNLRTEGERDPEFESGYRRTFASGDNCADNEDDDDDEELFVAKISSAGDNPDPDDSADKGVLEELRRLEKRRQWKLDSADDDEEEEEENENAAAGRSDGGFGDAAAAGAIRSYPRRIAESLRQATTEGERARRRAELRERRRQEKLSRRRELDRLVAMKEAEVEKKLERLRRNAGLDKSGNRGAAAAAAAAFGGDFLEADFDPAEHDKRMAGLFGEEFYHPRGEGEGEREGEGEDREEAKPVFSDDDWEGEGDGDVDDEARRLRDEADRMCAEDLIRAGPGEADVKCRFNYRQTEPNDFGLSAVEILLADDRELNAWCSLRKASQYREREADRRDRRRYRSARVQERKARLMPGMARRLEAAAACESAEDFAAAIAASTADPDAMATTPTASAAPGDVKKRRRRKKAKQQQQQEGSQQRRVVKDAALGDTPPRCRKKTAGPAAKKVKLDETDAATAATAAMSSLDGAKKQLKNKKKSKANSGGDRLQISEQRLLELGIDPKKFHRMRREAKGKRAKAKE